MMPPLLPGRSWLHRSSGSGQQSPDSLFFRPAKTSMLVSPAMLRTNICSHVSSPNAEARHVSALTMNTGVFRAIQSAGRRHTFALVMKIKPGSNTMMMDCNTTGLLHATSWEFCAFLNILKACDSQPAWECLQPRVLPTQSCNCSISLPTMVIDARHSHGGLSCSSRWWTVPGM